MAQDWLGYGSGWDWRRLERSDADFISEARSRSRVMGQGLHHVIGLRCKRVTRLKVRTMRGSWLSWQVACVSFAGQKVEEESVLLKGACAAKEGGRDPRAGFQSSDTNLPGPVNHGAVEDTRSIQRSRSRRQGPVSSTSLRRRTGEFHGLVRRIEARGDLSFVGEQPAAAGCNIVAEWADWQTSSGTTLPVCRRGTAVRKSFRMRQTSDDPSKSS